MSSSNVHLLRSGSREAGLPAPIPAAALRPGLVTVLVAFVLVLLLIPARFAFTFVSGQFTPALVIGLVALWLWLCLKAVPDSGLAPGRQPVRWLALVFVWSGGASFVTTYTRPTSDVEMRSAYIGLLILLSLAGVALLAADAIPDRRGLDLLLRWLVVAASVVAGIALIQFVTGVDLSQYLRPPGLQAGVDGTSFIAMRSSLRRSEGTANHPIELAVVLGMVLPIALHYARRPHPAGRGTRWLWWLCVSVLLVAIPTTVSRSGVIALIAVFSVVLPVWHWRERLSALVVMFVLAVLMRTAMPGLLGTLLALFTYLDADPSALHRNQDYATAAAYFPLSPWFGRGFHTFIPTEQNFHGLGQTGYPFIDNQYLLSLVETGLVGLLALLAALGVGIALAVLARRGARDEAGRDLANALTAALAAAVVTYLTFDALSFSMVRGVTFLVIGCAGALWRMQARPLPRAGNKC